MFSFYLTDITGELHFGYYNLPKYAAKGLNEDDIIWG